MVKSKTKIIITEEGLFNVSIEFHNLIVNDESAMVPLLDKVVMEEERVNLIVKEMSGGEEELDYMFVVLETKSYITSQELVHMANSIIKKTNCFNNTQLWKESERIAKGLVIPRESVEIRFNSEYPDNN